MSGSNFINNTSICPPFELGQKLNSMLARAARAPAKHTTGLQSGGTRILRVVHGHDAHAPSRPRAVAVQPRVAATRSVHQAGSAAADKPRLCKLPACPPRLRRRRALHATDTKPSKLAKPDR